MIELKPCPFCGGIARSEKYAAGNSSSSYIQRYRIGCNKCEMWFYGYIEISLDLEGEVVFIKNGFKDIVERWNGRA